VIKQHRDFGWRQPVLEALVPGASSFYIVEDADHLMTEPGIQKVLSENFNFYVFDDSIALRHFYESKIRLNSSLSDRLVISIDSDETDIRNLPFDITNQAKVVNLSLADCFPDFYCDVLRSLASEELDILYDATCEYTPGKLGDIASRDFVLRHVYQVAPEVIQSSSDLLRTLLRLHYRDIELPELLKHRLSELLIRRKQFVNWPIKKIISSKQLFFSFLQDHWPSYVEAVRSSLQKGAKEPMAVYQAKSEKAAEVILPYGHDDVRVYIDNLFLEGFLTPIEIENSEQFENHWCLVGMEIDAEKENAKRIIGLITRCFESLPDENSMHQVWYQFAHRWAELCSAYHTDNQLVDSEKFIELRNLVDRRFKDWMLVNYQSLHNHPPIPPTMLHHIPRNMVRDIESKNSGKTALILIDGLALDQWITLRNSIEMDHTKEESCVFAWVPTVTSVSRQALFSGKLPYQFSKSIQTTSGEQKAWQNYWLEHGLDGSEIFYEKGLGIGDVSTILDKLSDHRFRAVGLIINTVDEMMHGMLLGSAGMHNQVELWAKSGFLSKLIDGLVNYGFVVHITSDHGNVEAKGCGKINEGAIADSRGERMRVYKSQALMSQTHQFIICTSHSVIEWPQIGLPSDYWAIVMSGREAFVTQNECIVGHGGISIEEVIVPYIKIYKEKL